MLRAAALSTLFLLCSPLALIEMTHAADMNFDSVIYVTGADMFDASGREFSLAKLLAEKGYDSRRIKNQKALGELVGSDDAPTDLLRQIGCPQAATLDACTNVVVVSEKALDAYMKSHPSSGHLVVRVAMMGLTKGMYEVSIAATLFDSTGDLRKKRHVGSYYRDDGATPESVAAAYRESLQEVAQMVRYGLSVDRDDATNAMPPDWLQQPRLNEIKARGLRRCVKNPVGDRIVQDHEARAWLGAVQSYGLQMTSLAWIECK